MADLTIIASGIRLIEGVRAEILPCIAGGALTAGYLVYENSSGQLAGTDADAAGTAKALGIALTSPAAAGQPVSVLIRGRVVGYDLSGVNPGVTIWNSVTVGKLADAKSAVAGDYPHCIGACHREPDGSRSVLVNIDPAYTPVVNP